jgi:histidine triad (HIT) family protein
MKKDCIFCKIVKKDIPAKIVKETDDLIVIPDIKSGSLLHLLIISKKHLSDFRDDDGKIWKSMAELAKTIIKDKNLKAVRLVHNIGKATLVKHMHMHLLEEVDEKREV